MVDTDALMNKLGVDAMIRIQEDDYTQLPADQMRLGHFNLPHSGHQVGLRYALPCIVRPGYRTEDHEVLPLLLFENCRLGTCTSYTPYLSYDDLNEAHFRFSFSHIKTKNSLLQAMIKRYQQSRPHLSPKEIEAMGVSFTEITF